MKTSPQSQPFLFKIILLIACFLLVMLYNQSKAATIPVSLHNTTSKIAVNFKNDIGKNELTISIKSGTAADLQLFIFSPDGILISQVAVSTHKTTIATGLTKGYYLYECFNKDERMKSGSLLIR